MSIIIPSERKARENNSGDQTSFFARNLTEDIVALKGPHPMNPLVSHKPEYLVTLSETTHFLAIMELKFQLKRQNINICFPRVGGVNKCNAEK